MVTTAIILLDEVLYEVPMTRELEAIIFQCREDEDYAAFVAYVERHGTRLSPETHWVVVMQAVLAGVVFGVLGLLILWRW